MNLYDADKLKTIEDFAALKAKGHCSLHIITMSPYAPPKLNSKTIGSIKEIIDALCFRLHKNDKNNQIAETLEKLPKPYDIWIYEQDKEKKYENWLGREKTKIERFSSYNFIFDRKLTETEVSYWNLFIVGRYC